MPDRSPDQLIVTMANGYPIPVRPDWQHLEEYRGPNGETTGALIRLGTTVNGG